MKRKRYRIVVNGFLGLLPAGGVAWDYLQYPLGFALLGHDVYYIEDTMRWPVFQKDGSDWSDCSAGVEYLKGAMEAFGLADRWAYRDVASGACFGMSIERVQEICRTADIFVNVSWSSMLREEYLRIPLRLLVDSDPMFTHIAFEEALAKAAAAHADTSQILGHTHYFTYAENIGKGDCRVPQCGLSWHVTRYPVCLAHWPATPLPADGAAAYTTVMNWNAATPLKYANETWGQKNLTFPPFFPLPRLLPSIPFAVATNRTVGPGFPVEEAERNCWKVLDPGEVTPDWRSYRSFIQRSRGEFTVAKETYVKSRSAWFSGRSACYLASGRPVVTQDTGWSKYIGNGEGALAFHDLDSAIEALKRVEADPQSHARAARAVAEEYFDSNRILSDLLTVAGA